MDVAYVSDPFQNSACRLLNSTADHLEQCQHRNGAKQRKKLLLTLQKQIYSCRIRSRTTNKENTHKSPIYQNYSLRSKIFDVLNISMWTTYRLK